MIQRANNGLPVQAAPPRRTKVPAAARIAIWQVRAEQPISAVQGQGNVLHVHMENPVRKPTDELDPIHTLPETTARGGSEAELLSPAEGIEGHLGRVQAKSYLPRVHFKRIANA